MLDQPERVLHAFGAVLLTAGPIRALIVRHQLESRREVVRIRRQLPFEPGHIGLLQVEDAAQGLHVPRTKHAGRGLRLRGKGGPGLGGGASGDLFLVIHVAAHPFFRREGNDIYMDLPISVAEAALGGAIDVPTVRGRTSVHVPPGTASGARLRLRGQGLSDPKTGVLGDQYCLIRIVPPKTLDERRRRLYEELRAAGEDNPRAGLPWSQ